MAMQRMAAIIKRHGAEIVRLWADEAERAASARGLSRPEFENVIPHYVTALAEDGNHSFGRLDGDRRKLVENHLATRLRQGFDLPEVIEEFAILGRVVAHFCDNANESERPSAVEARAFFAELAESASMVADSFRDHLLNAEQADKRYARLLEQIASEALQPGAPPFSERLNEVVALIVEAMSARAGALLLYETGTGRLITSASAGIPGSELERYSASLSPSSFAGLVAGSDEPTHVADFSSTHLEVSESLRKIGIQSLLGIRLLPHRTLVGVLLLARGEQVHLSLADHVKLVMLGERLTLHLENARLYAALEAKVEALTAERALRERFVSVLAHDLRGPLSTAKTGARLLVTTPGFPEDERAIASRVDRSLDRCERMIRDLLDANRVRAGEKLPLEIQELDPGELARALTGELEELHGRRFAVSIQSTLRVFWSSSEIRRALWNLLTNAIKYGASDGIITVRLETRRDDIVALSVHNWGAPITPEDQGHIFDPFVRTKGAKALGPGKGWGLGLTLVRGCAEAHGGSVHVTSSAAMGTTFTMLLPRDASPLAQPAADDRLEGNASEPADNRGNVNIRADALALHDDVKKMLRVVLHHIATLERGDASAASALQTSIDELVTGLRHLYTEEHRTLEPALRSLDAWGERHVTDLHAQHDRELASVDSARAVPPGPEELAKRARAVVRVILRALRLEAATVLDQDRWSDDLTIIDQEGG